VRRLLVVALVPVLILAAPAAARVRMVGGALLGHPTLVGSRVLYENPGVASDGTTAYVLDSLGTSGRPRMLVSAPTTVVHSEGTDHTTSYVYAATPTHLALAELDGSTRGSKDLGSVTLSFSALDGSATETIASCEQPIAPHAPPFAVDASRIAFVEGACEGTPETVVIHDPGVSEVRIAVPADRVVDAVALAGDYVAYDLSSPVPGGPAPEIVVASRATGAESFHVDGSAGPFALQSDGTLAIVGGGVCPSTVLMLASPAAPTPQVVPGAHPCAPVRLAGGRVVYRDASAHLHVASAAAGDATLIDARVGDFDADATNAVYTFPDCAGRAIYRVGLTESPAAPAVPGSCAVGVRRTALRLRGSRVVVPLSCPRACHGTIALRRGAQLASTRFAVSDPGTGQAELRLSVSARRRLGHGRLAATLTVRSILPSGSVSTRHVKVVVSRPGR
jgi:hypothetical protein